MAYNRRRQRHDRAGCGGDQAVHDVGEACDEQCNARHDDGENRETDERIGEQALRHAEPREKRLRHARRDGGGHAVHRCEQDRQAGVMHRQHAAASRCTHMGTGLELVVSDQSPVVCRVIVADVEVAIHEEAARDDQIVGLVAAGRVLSMRRQPPHEDERARGNRDSRRPTRRAGHNQGIVDSSRQGYPVRD